MNIFIANFGARNWAWPECREHDSMVVMDDERVHPFWLRGDRLGYIAAAQEYLQSASGGKVISAVASRWFNVSTIFHETAGDLWIHRDKDDLWWTTSLDSTPQFDVRIDPQPTHGSEKIYVYRKKCSGWSNTKKTGERLLWNGLHIKARDFLSTESTFQKLSPEYAAYARALIEGGDLSPWHNRSEWKSRADKSGKGAVSSADALLRTATRMADRALAVTLRSGEERVIITKAKEFGFASKQEMEVYIQELLKDSEKLCMLTNLPMLLDGEDGDREMLASLDRIDSDKGYVRDNLQVVCWFVNRWKGVSKNQDFLRLVKVVQDGQ